MGLEGQRQNQVLLSMHSRLYMQCVASWCLKQSAAARYVVADFVVVAVLFCSVSHALVSHLISQQLFSSPPSFLGGREVWLGPVPRGSLGRRLIRRYEASPPLRSKVTGDSSKVTWGGPSPLKTKAVHRQ